MLRKQSEREPDRRGREAGHDERLPTSPEAREHRRRQEHDDSEEGRHADQKPGLPEGLRDRKDVDRAPQERLQSSPPG